MHEISHTDLGRKSVSGIGKSEDTEEGGCLVCLRAVGKPAGKLLKLSEGIMVTWMTRVLEDLIQEVLH